jgi:hypothetical protein
MKPRHALALLALAALVVAGCGEDDDMTTTNPDPPAPESDEVLLQVATGGGFVPSSSRLAEIPELSVYGDGRFIILGPTTQEFPGAALPNLQEGQLSGGELDDLAQKIAEAGLTDDPPPEYGDPGVTDLPTTVVTVTVDGEERSVAAYALDFVEGDDELEDDEREAREQLRDVIGSVDVDEASKTYEPGALAVFIQPFDADERGDSPPAQTLDWPLGDLAGAGEPYEGFDDTSCLVLTGDDAQTAIDAAGDANEGDAWNSGDQLYALVFRPLLPDESSCADLSPEEVGGA